MDLPETRVDVTYIDVLAQDWGKYITNTIFRAGMNKTKLNK